MGYIINKVWLLKQLTVLNFESGIFCFKSIVLTNDYIIDSFKKSVTKLILSVLVAHKGGDFGKYWCNCVGGRLMESKLESN